MPAVSKDFVAAYDVLLGGAPIDPDLKGLIKEIRVVDHLRLPDVCSFSVIYPGAERLDQHPFAIATALEIRLGATEDTQATTLFRGEIVTLEPEFGAGSVELHVRAYDRSHRLHRSRQVRTFQNQTASDIVTRIVRDAGLSPQCDASGPPFEFMQQNNETDWDFIWRLADRIGFEFLIEDRIAHFRRPSPAADAVELNWPDTLRSFSPRLTAVQQVDEVSVFAYDPKTKRILRGRASRPNQLAQIGVPRSEVAGQFGAAKVHVATEPVKSQAEANALAQALLDRLANAYVAAEGLTFGNPAIKAGSSVKVSGVGGKFSGTYRVATSTHILRGGSTYETKFANSPVHTMSGAMGGADGTGLDFGAQLVLGRVTNNADPAKMGRVRVYFPALGEEHEGAWARVAVSSAGNERGLMMLPVPGEEVLLAFEHGDTTRPYVIGSLFNGRDQPGDELAAKDGSLGVLSDHKVVVRAKEDIEIAGDQALKVTVSGDVEERFAANWSEEVRGSGELKTTGQLTIESTGQLMIKGGPSVSLESSGTMKIQAAQLDIDGGALVNIKGGLINLG
jgi:phage protein D